MWGYEGQKSRNFARLNRVLDHLRIFLPFLEAVVIPERVFAPFILNKVDSSFLKNLV